MPAPLRLWLNEYTRRLKTKAGETGYNNLVCCLRSIGNLSSSKEEGVRQLGELLGTQSFLDFTVTHEDCAMLVCRAIYDVVPNSYIHDFRFKHSEHVGAVAKAACSDTNNNIPNIAVAILALSKTISTATISFPYFRRLLNALKTQEEKRLSEGELRIVVFALTTIFSRMRTYQLNQIDTDEIISVVTMLRRRYSGRTFVDALGLYCLPFLPIDDAETVVAAAIANGEKSRGTLMVCYFRLLSSVTRSDKVHDAKILRLTPYITKNIRQNDVCLVYPPSIINLNHMTVRYRSMNHTEGVECLTKLIKKMWSFHPTEDMVRTHHRWVYMRYSLLFNGLDVEVSLEDIYTALDVLSKPTENINIPTVMRGIRSVAVLPNAPRDACATTLETVILRNRAYLSNPETMSFALRHLCDARLPMTQKAITALVDYVRSSGIRDIDNIAQVILVISVHASAETQSAMIKELMQTFVSATPQAGNSTMSYSILIGMYCAVIRCGTPSKAFFDKAAELNSHFDSSYMKDGEVSAVLGAMPVLLEWLRPLMGTRSRDVRNFYMSLIDLMSDLILSIHQFNAAAFRRTISFCCIVATLGTPGKNVNAVLRPLLRHLVEHHTIIPESLSGYTRALLTGYRQCRSTVESRRLVPMLNLFCTLTIRHEDQLQPAAASFALLIVSKKGSLTESVNSNHQELARICGNIIFNPKNRELVKTFINVSNSVWLPEALAASVLFDIPARIEFMRILNEMPEEDMKNILKDRTMLSLQWSLGKGEILYTS